MKYNKFDFGRDFYSNKMGFVLDGMHFRSYMSAMNYLTDPDKGCMEHNEAERYLSRMVRAFNAAAKA